MYMVMIINGDDGIARGNVRFFDIFDEARAFLKNIIFSDSWDETNIYRIYLDDGYGMDIIMEWFADYETGKPYEHFYQTEYDY